MYRPGLDKLPCYSVGQEPNWLVKLDANERSAPLPRQVKQAMQRRIRSIEPHRYPEILAETLRGQLAESFQLSIAEVNVGNGSSELIAAVCSVFGGPGRPIAYQWPSFSMYPIYASMADSPPVAIW